MNRIGLLGAAHVVGAFLLSAATASAAPLTVNTPLAAAGLGLSAFDTPALAVDNLTITNNATLTAFAGSLSLSAGDDFFLDAGTVASATGEIIVSLDLADADPGFGSTAVLAGLLTAPTITINGGLDADVLNYLGAPGTLVFDPSDPTSGTISGAGFATITFHGIESVIGNVQTPVAAVPEPASLLLLGTGLLAGHRYRRRVRR